MHERNLALSDKTLLITGPTGAGKSRKAVKLHAISKRANEPFIHVNLCNFARDLFESELFGHSRGAFTGAHTDKAGFLASVGRGTLFLDEVGELSPETQAKLLMLLEEGIYYPVGSTTPKRFEGRLIFATNRELAEMAKKGEFREDLYHRLRTFELKLESLSSFPQLKDTVQNFFVRAKQEAGKSTLLLSSEVENFLYTYHWPGNYRELKNLLEYFVTVANEVVHLEHLPPYLKSVDKQDFGDSQDYHGALATFERAFLTRMLRERGYRINKTAREINISKVTLLSKMKKYDIKKENNNLSGEKAI